MKIGQAAQLTGLTISNIRFYERKLQHRSRLRLHRHEYL